MVLSSFQLVFSFIFLRKDERLSILIEYGIEFQIWAPILVKKAKFPN